MTEKLLEITIQLPDGYTDQSGDMKHLPEAVELFNRCSLNMIGKAVFEEKDAQTEWTSPGFNLETDQRLVFDPHGQLVGYSEVWTDNEPPVNPWVWARVDPDHQGLGIGTYLLQWAEQRSRQVFDRVPPEARVAMDCGAFAAYQPGRELLEGYGMTHNRTSYQMRIDMNEAPPKPEWPEGFTVRTYNHPDEDDARAIYYADHEAFRDHWGFVDADGTEEGFNRFWHFQIENDDAFDPELWFVVMDGDQIAGTCICKKWSHEDKDVGWVGDLSVLRPWRKRGLGLAMLLHSFNEFWARGITKVGLGVDAQNLSGALRLYEKAGMHVHREWVNYEKELRPGISLVTTDLEE